MAQVSSTVTIHAPADAIWQVISRFGAAGPYLVDEFISDARSRPVCELRYPAQPDPPLRAAGG